MAEDIPIQFKSYPGNMDGLEAKIPTRAPTYLFAVLSLITTYPVDENIKEYLLRDPVLRETIFSPSEGSYDYNRGFINLLIEMFGMSYGMNVPNVGMFQHKYSGAIQSYKKHVLRFSLTDTKDLIKEQHKIVAMFWNYSPVVTDEGILQVT